MSDAPVSVRDLLLGNVSLAAGEGVARLPSYSGLLKALGGGEPPFEGQRLKDVVDSPQVAKALDLGAWLDLDAKALDEGLAAPYVRPSWAADYRDLVSRERAVVVPPNALALLLSFKVLAVGQVKERTAALALISWLLVNDERGAQEYFRRRYREERGALREIDDEEKEVEDLENSTVDVRDVLFGNPFPQVAERLSQQVTFQITFRRLIGDLPPDFIRYASQLDTLAKVRKFMDVKEVRDLFEKADWPERLKLPLHATAIPSVPVPWIAEYRECRSEDIVGFAQAMKTLGVDAKQAEALGPYDQEVMWVSYFYLHDQKPFSDFVYNKRQAALARKDAQAEAALAEYRDASAAYVKRTTAAGIKPGLGASSNHLRTHEQKSADSRDWLEHVKLTYPKRATAAEDVLKMAPAPAVNTPAGKTDAPLTKPFPAPPKSEGAMDCPSTEAVDRPSAWSTTAPASKTVKTVGEGIVLAKALIDDQGRPVFEELEPERFAQMAAAMARDGLDPALEAVEVVPSSPFFTNAARSQGFALPAYVHEQHYRYFVLDEADDLLGLYTVFEAFQKTRFAEVALALAKSFPKEPLSAFINVCTDKDQEFLDQVAARQRVIDAVRRLDAKEAEHRAAEVAKTEGRRVRKLDDFVASKDAPERYLILDAELGERLNLLDRRGDRVVYELLFERDDPARFATILKRIKAEVPASEWCEDWAGLASEDDYAALRATESALDRTFVESRPLREEARPLENEVKLATAGFPVRYVAGQDASNKKLNEYADYPGFLAAMRRLPQSVGTMGSDELVLHDYVHIDGRVKDMIRWADEGKDARALALDDPDAFLLTQTFKHLDTLDVSMFGLGNGGRLDQQMGPLARTPYALWARGSDITAGLENETSKALCYASLVWDGRERLQHVRDTVRSLSSQVLETDDSSALNNMPFSAQIEASSPMGQLVFRLLGSDRAPKAPRAVAGVRGEFNYYPISYVENKVPEGPKLLFYSQQIAETEAPGRSFFCVIAIETNVSEEKMRSLADYFEAVRTLEDTLRDQLLPNVVLCPFTEPTYIKQEDNMAGNRYISLYLRVPAAPARIDEDVLFTQSSVTKVLAFLSGMPRSPNRSNPYDYVENVVRDAYKGQLTAPKRRRPMAAAMPSSSSSSSSSNPSSSNPSSSSSSSSRSSSSNPSSSSSPSSSEEARPSQRFRSADVRKIPSRTGVALVKGAKEANANLVNLCLGTAKQAVVEEPDGRQYVSDAPYSSAHQSAASLPSSPLTDANALSLERVPYAPPEPWTPPRPQELDLLDAQMQRNGASAVGSAQRPAKTHGSLGAPSTPVSGVLALGQRPLPVFDSHAFRTLFPDDNE